MFMRDDLSGKSDAEIAFLLAKARIHDLKDLLAKAAIHVPHSTFGHSMADSESGVRSDDPLCLRCRMDKVNR